MLKNFSNERFDIIIQAGQSNASGSGVGPADAPYCADDRVWFMNGDFTISMAAESVSENHVRSDFSLSFVRNYIRAGRLEEGRRVLVLRTAVGGTGFLDNRWKNCDDLYIRMIAMIRTALELNPENRLIALLWHQGETDAIYHASYETHYGHLMNLVDSVRREFDAPTLPFVAGDFVQEWKQDNLSIAAPVVDAIRAVVRDCAQAGFVETEGLESNHLDGTREGDNIHFSRQSLYELGERYFDMFQQI